MTDFLPLWLQSLLFPSSSPSVAASVILLFFVMFLGIVLGKLKIYNVSLGISGIVFSGILLGHLGYRLDEGTYEFMRDFGLILFVYAIGMQVGPSFFNHLKNDGILYNSLAAGTAIMASLLTILLFYASGIHMDILVGLMSGAVTNTPGLGAAKAALHDLEKSLPQQVFHDPTHAYAIAYPFGIIGIILAMIVAGKIFRIDPKKESEDFLQNIRKKHPVPESVKCRITQEAFIGKSIKYFLEQSGLSVIVTRVKHSGSNQSLAPQPEGILNERDVIKLVGLPEDLDKAITLLGYRSSDMLIESEEITRSKTIVITHSTAIHKTIGELNLEGAYHVTATRVYRTGMELLAQPDLELHYGDRLRVVGYQKDLEQVSKLLGNSEKKLQEPQLLSIFIGIVLGVICGSVPLLLPGLSVPVKLGMAAGPLLVSIIISRFGGIRNLHSYLQQSALLFMKEFGISLFFAAIGIHAGASFYETFLAYNGWLWMGYGLLLTLIPILLFMLVARYLFKLNFMPMLGLVAGSYTDPAALDFCTRYYKSDLPVQAYATVYPLVTILRIIMAQMLILYFTV